MAQDKWKLTGEAYGRTYNAVLTFLYKENVAVSPEIVERNLALAAWNKPDGEKEELRKQISSHEQARFMTEDGIEVMVSPRYAGSKLGSSDDGKGNTICAFIYNGKYVALATYNEQKKEIAVHEY